MYIDFEDVLKIEIRRQKITEETEKVTLKIYREGVRPPDYIEFYKSYGQEPIIIEEVTRDDRHKDVRSKTKKHLC